MTFVSHAQNFEDVILRRALGEVENGFYVDVGANDPVIDSVTKSFYDTGWRGINIEPVGEYYESLLRNRPGDTNIQVALGDDQGEIDFYEVVGTGLSTVDRLTAEKHARERGYQIKSYRVPTETLSSILKTHPLPVIHFLKIDVEGSEKSVLKGLDLSETRPWIILIESTLPNSEVENYAEWEFILLAADYEFAYFDGLNRFYVATEHQEIKKRLNLPPNVFDDFVLSGFSSSSFHGQIASFRSQLTEIERQLQVAGADFKNQKAKVNALEQTHLHWKHESERLKSELQAVFSSKSWRITHPLRILWKPFKSKKNSTPLKSHKPSTASSAAVQKRLKSESPTVVGHAGSRPSIDEILNRIKKELENER